MDDVKDNMVITSVSGKSVNNNNLVDPNDYDLDDNNINILKDLELKGFKEICVVPKIKENYWICSCGNVNTSDFCTNCGTKKAFASLYDTEEKIHKKFALREYEKNRFSSENLDEEILSFKNKLKNNKKYNINIDYLDEEFFKNIDEQSKFKVESFKNKKSNFKLVSKYLILIFIIILILLVVSSTISNNASLEDMENRIAKSCDSTEYSKVNDIDSVIGAGNCGTLVYYMINNDLSSNDLILLANSEKVELYKSYYSYKKENIHQTLGSNGKIDNDQYSKYLSVGDKEWEYDYEYFEAGYDSIDVDNYTYEIGREKNLKKIY